MNAYYPGTVTIRATSAFNEEIYDEITITVYTDLNAPTSLTIDASECGQIFRYETATLYARDQNGELIESEVVWHSSDNDVATVNEEEGYAETAEGVVRSYQTGIVTIRAYSLLNPGAYDEITISVTDPYMNCPSSISIEITSGSAEMSVGDRLLLEAYDESGDYLFVDFDIEVYSDDESIAKAGQVDTDTAYVDAISPGTVDIIVKSVANPTVYETLTVTVTE